jgi:hypothetical protein
VPKAYANNFLHEPKKIKHIKTKWFDLRAV